MSPIYFKLQYIRINDYREILTLKPDITTKQSSIYISYAVILYLSAFIYPKR